MLLDTNMQVLDEYLKVYSHHYRLEHNIPAAY